jgi:ribosomal protein L18
MRERKELKTTEKKEIVVRDDDRNYSCQLEDISASGVSVSISHFIPTYKEIGVVMEIDGEKVAMTGSVRWSIDAAIARDKKGKLGIRIMNPPPAFLAYVKKLGGPGR